MCHTFLSSRPSNKFLEKLLRRETVPKRDACGNNVLALSSPSLLGNWLRPKKISRSVIREWKIKLYGSKPRSSVFSGCGNSEISYIFFLKINMFDFSVVLDKLNEMEVYNNNFNGN